MKSKREYLIQFKLKLVRYNELRNKGNLSPNENTEMGELRQWLNRAIPLAGAFVQNAGQSTTVQYAPPPIVGGLSGPLDLLANLFQLQKFQIPQSMVYDLIDRAIGTYDFLLNERVKKWVNPLFWIGEIIRFPFLILKFSGFDGLKIEKSIFGKTYKFIIALATTLVTAFELYNYVKPFVTNLLIKGNP